jgi:hypothetical protein
MFVTPPSLAGVIVIWANRFDWWQKKGGITNIRAFTCVERAQLANHLARS